MIVGASLWSANFLVFTSVALLAILAMLSTALTTRDGKSLTVATVVEATIRSVTATLILWGIFFGMPAMNRISSGFGTELPKLTALFIKLGQSVQHAAGTPQRFGYLLFLSAAAVATDSAFFHQLGRSDLRQSRTFSIAVSLVTFFVLGVVAFMLALPLINILTDLS
jgi:hypothetical protein